LLTDGRRRGARMDFFVVVKSHIFIEKKQGLKTKRNRFFSETRRNVKYLRKRETKRNETIYKVMKLKRNNNFVSRKNIEKIILPARNILFWKFESRVDKA
jgi:hypothetical protein